jgi:hypothetical protein
MNGMEKNFEYIGIKTKHGTKKKLMLVEDPYNLKLVSSITKTNIYLVIRYRI